MKTLYKLPFVGSTSVSRFMPTRYELVGKYLGADVYENFAKAYVNLLEAIEDKDMRYIETCTAPNIYRFLEEQIQLITDTNKLQIKSTQIPDDGYKGGVGDFREIMKNRNNINYRVWQSPALSLDVSVTAMVGLSSATRQTNKQIFNKHPRYYYIDKTNILQSIKDMWAQQLLIIYVDIMSKKRLYIQNDEGGIVDQSEGEWVRSTLRFETDANNIDYRLTDINNIVYDYPYINPTKKPVSRQ